MAATDVERCSVSDEGAMWGGHGPGMCMDRHTGEIAGTHGKLFIIVQLLPAILHPALGSATEGASLYTELQLQGPMSPTPTSRLGKPSAIIDIGPLFHTVTI